MFKKPFSFDGRIRRTEYGLTFIIFAMLTVLVDSLSNTDEAALIGLAYIPMYWALLAQGAKRCHDIGNSGWWQLIPFYALWLLFQDGQPGSNQYGENPKGIQVNGEPSYTNTKNASIPSAEPTITDSGYQGGYSGGHNTPTKISQTNKTINENEYTDEDGYKDGDLYK